MSLPLKDKKININKKLLRGVQMLHGAVFSKRAPLAAGGKKNNKYSCRSKPSSTNDLEGAGKRKKFFSENSGSLKYLRVEIEKEETMKKQSTKKQERKLNLGKIDIYHFPTILDRDEQKQARGGSADTRPGTYVPIFC